MSQHEPPGAERIEALLAGAQPADPSERELRDLLRSARGPRLEHEWTPERARRITSRVLERTTRQDLSWRGDLRVRLRLVARGLQESPLWRLVAASLLLHLVAVPVFAFYFVREAERPPAVRLGFELPPEELPEPTEETFEVVLPDATPHAEVPAYTADEVEAALRRARYRLSTAHGPALPGTEDAPGANGASNLRDPKTTLLRARIRLLRERTWAPSLDEEEAWGESDLSTRVLWTHLLLDRTALLGARSPLLPRVLHDLASASPNGPALRLGRDRVLARAASYGLWGRPSSAESVPVLGPDEDASILGLFSDGPAPAFWSAYAAWDS